MDPRNDETHADAFGDSSTDNVLSFVLSATGVALLLMNSNANNKLQKCTANDDANDDDTDTHTCESIKAVTLKRKDRYQSFLGMPFPKNYGMTNVRSAVTGLFKNFLLNQTERTGVYNIEALRFVVDQFKDERQSTLLVPSLIAYCMVCAKLKRDETVEKMLLEKINALNNDPFDSKNSILDTYTNLTYRAIMMNYQKYNNIDIYKPNDEPWKRMFDKDLNYNSFPSDPAVMLLKDGFYNNKDTGEIGFVFKQKASGLYELTKYVEPFYYLTASDRLVQSPDRKFLAQFLTSSFERMRFAVRGNYVQVRGNDTRVVVPYKGILLDALMKLHRLYPSRCALSTEQWFEISNLNGSYVPQINFENVCGSESDEQSSISLNRADEWFKEAVVTSRSEGFVYYTKDWFVFEQSCASPYLRFEAGDTDDQLKRDKWIISGYINYGCDFTRVFDLANNFTTNVLLPGQVVYITNVVGTAMIVKLEDSLYYVSMHNQDQLHIGGVLDGKTRTHHVFIDSVNKYLFCLFGWVSDQPIVVMTNDTWCTMYAHNVRVMMKCSNRSDGSNVDISPNTVGLLDGGQYCYFTINIGEKSSLEYTVMMFRDTDDKDMKTFEDVNMARIKNYNVKKNHDSDVQLTPSTSVCATIVNTVTKTRIVVDENMTLNRNNPIEAKVGSNTFKFSDNSMGRFVSIPG